MTRSPLLFRTRVNDAGETVRIKAVVGFLPTKSIVLSFPPKLTVAHGGLYHRHITRIPHPTPDARRMA